MADWRPAMPLSGRTAHRGGTSFSFRRPSDTRGSTALSIGLFNVQGLSSGTKRDRLLSDLSSHQITVCCLQETKCEDSFDEIHWGYRLLGLQFVIRIPPSNYCKHQFFPNLAQTSTKQRDLRLCLNNTTYDRQRQQLKQQRNNVVMRKALDDTSAILDEHAAEVEKLHYGARMFRAVCLLCRRPYLQVVIHDGHGRVLEDLVEVDKRVTEYFGQQFRETCSWTSNIQGWHLTTWSTN